MTKQLNDIMVNNKEYIAVTDRQLKKLNDHNISYTIIETYENSENDYNSTENKHALV